MFPVYVVNKYNLVPDRAVQGSSGQFRAVQASSGQFRAVQASSGQFRVIWAVIAELPMT